MTHFSSDLFHQQIDEDLLPYNTWQSSEQICSPHLHGKKRCSKAVSVVDPGMKGQSVIFVR